MEFDLKQVPFSHFGSFIVLSYLPDPSQGENLALYFRSVHGGDEHTEQGRVFKIELVDCNQQLVPFQTSLTPSQLTLISKEGNVSFCFEHAECLLGQGNGVGVRLSMITNSYDNAVCLDSKTVRVNHFSLDVKVNVKARRGQLTCHAPWDVKHSCSVQIDFQPDAEQQVLLALQTFVVVPTEHKPRSYEEAQAQAKKDFAGWLCKTLAVPEEFESGRQLAAYITWSSVVPARGQLKRPAMYMSKHVMTNIWSWDHCFNAMALAKHQPELAWEQMMVIFDHQHASGMLPDFINDKFCYWSGTKPPVHGWAFQYLIQENPEFYDIQKLKETYAVLEHWTQFWLQRAEEFHEDLPFYFHGNDSGWDNGTVFHEGVPVQSPDLPTFLILQMDCLIALAQRLGMNSKAEEWGRRQAEMMQKLMEKLWHRDHFGAYLLKNDQPIQAGDSLLNFMPLLLGNRLSSQVRGHLLRGLQADHRFLTPHGLATESLGSSLYEADGYWRGPIWAPSTMLMVDGLRRCGKEGLALDIARRFATMAQTSGMAENFDALTGIGQDDPAFTWTSSVFLLLANRKEMGRNA